MQLIIRILILLILSTFCRLVFYVYNFSLFPDIDFLPFIMGLRFDLSMVIWGSFFLLIVEFISSFLISQKWISKLSLVYFLMFAFCIVLVNFIDVGLFKFTFSRFSVDTLAFLFHGNDMANVIPKAVRDYWFLALALIGLVYLLFLLEKWIQTFDVFKNKKRGLYLLMIPFFVLAARGGFQIKPITIIDASLFINPSYIPVVLNGPFSLFTTLIEGDAAEDDVMDVELAEKMFPIDQSINSDYENKGKNVVILIMESFGKEYLDEGYMPFLDSLKGESLYFKNTYANGKRSIDAVPAIFASIPDLNLKSYIYSKYAGSDINTLPKCLLEKGYSTSFYHGGRNGTMSFDKFATIAGFQEYYGLNEYPNKEDYDGTWGIYDEPFFSNFSDELTRKSKSKKPFLAALFSLSSHHPFKLPKAFKGVFSAGTHPLHKTLQYSDLALKKFFEKASKEPWFENTVFVITADHTSIPDHTLYHTDWGLYRVPLVFYAPGDSSVQGERSDLAQQLDIFPSILSYLGYDSQVKSFGRDLFNTSLKSRGVLNRSNGVFRFYSDSLLVKSTPTEVKGVYLNSDTLMKNDLSKSRPLLVDSLEKEILARFQVFKTTFQGNRYN